MQHPTFHVNDLVIFTPEQVAALKDPDLPGNAFLLMRVVEDKGSSFDYEPLESGPCALVESLALLSLPKGAHLWLPPELRDVRRELPDNDIPF